jgi:thiol-disulfide isomerase/thioredoxin
VSKTVWWIIGGLVGLGLIVVIAASIAGEEEVDPNIGYGTVTVEGDVDALPVLTDPATDAATGMTAPTVTGADWDDNESTIAPDGRAKILVFLAHWCPHCQAEVPLIQDWVDAGGVPEGVDLYGLTVLTERLQPNWPPQDWLIEEGWTSPVIMDDAAGSAAIAYGLGGTPMYIVLDGDNTVVQRVSGEIGTAGLDALADLAAAS